MMREQYFMRVVEASGSAYKLGFEIGSQCQDLARDMVEDRRRELKQKYNMDWDRARVIARKCLSFCEDSIPKDVEELKGYAEGAGLELEEVFTPFSALTRREKSMFLGAPTL